MKKYIMTLAVLAASVIPVLAQAPSPPATPIDGGLSLLLIAGGAYGAKKVFDHKK